MLFYLFLSLPHTYTRARAHPHTHVRTHAHTHARTHARTHTRTHAHTYIRAHISVLYLSICFAISIILRTKISLSILCLLKDEISHLLNPLLKLPNKIELIVSSFFSLFGYVVCFTFFYVIDCLPETADTQ